MLESPEADETHRLLHQFVAFVERSHAYLVVDEVVQPERHEDGSWTVDVRARTPGCTYVPIEVMDDLLRRAMEDPRFGKGVPSRCTFWDADIVRMTNWAMLAAAAALYGSGHLAWLMTPWAALAAGVGIAFGQIAAYVRQRHLMPRSKAPMRYSVQIESRDQPRSYARFMLRLFFD